MCVCVWVSVCVYRVGIGRLQEADGKLNHGSLHETFTSAHEKINQGVIHTSISYFYCRNDFRQMMSQLSSRVKWSKMKVS